MPDRLHGRLVFREPNGVILTEQSNEGDIVGLRVGDGNAILYTSIDCQHPNLPSLVRDELLQLGIPMLKTAYRSYFALNANRQNKIWEHTYIGYSRPDAMFFWYAYEPPGSISYKNLNRFKYRVIQSYMRNVL